MSDNIVDRLREWARKGIARNVCRGPRRMSDDITGAADEIERLQAECRTLRNAAVTADEKAERLQSALDAAVRDAERMRAELAVAVELFELDPECNEAGTDAWACLHRARSALSSERGGK